jgi:hypothetical protein
VRNLQSDTIQRAQLVVLTDALWVLLELTLEGRDPRRIGHHLFEWASEEQCGC